MKKMKPLIVANWKMNPASAELAHALFVETERAAGKNKNVKVVVCPPYIYLPELEKIKNKSVELGAQDVFSENAGSFTGEIGPQMLKKQGEKYVIIGHSERREIGETDELISKKVLAALKAKLKVILCVGESVRDGHGEYLLFLRNQLNASLSGVSKRYLKDLIIAYEPIWAIGKSDEEAMKPTDLHETSLYIKKVLSEIYKSPSVISIPILYGGSVSFKNANELLTLGEVQGLLVGHESLSAKKFESLLLSLEN
jgi:triosephosphate isomerase